jgi:hypothetical protein
VDAVRCRSRSWAARTFGAAPHYASRNDEASIGAGPPVSPFQQPVIIGTSCGPSRAGDQTQNRIPLLLIANSWLPRDRTQNRIPLLLIANSWLPRDRTQNRIPLLLIALGC